MITCIDAFKNLNITSLDSKLSISPCCLIKSKPIEPIDFINNKYLNSVRDQWSRGEFPTECSTCKQAEQNGKVSRRIGSNQWYKDNKLENSTVELVRLDYWTGDLCNLKCVICGPQFSSSWKQEIGIPIDQRKVIVNKNWKNIDLSTIQYIHFNGGEPLLSKEHVLFLQEIPNKTSISLFYNTNGTILPGTELLDLWEKFKLVQIDFSVDDLYDRFDYQRYPATWGDLVKNLNYFKEMCPVNCMFGINTTLSILNNSNYKNLLDWLSKNFSTNKVTDPVEFRTQFASGIFRIQEFETRKQEIKNYLDKIDSRRGTNWRHTFPDIVELL